MSKSHFLRQAIKRELEDLNHKIDSKIVRGRSYIREARRHKYLLSQLYGLNRVQQRNWFSFVSTFLF